MAELTDAQEREVRRLVDEEGLSEEQARTLATERQLDEAPRAATATVPASRRVTQGGRAIRVGPPSTPQFYAFRTLEGELTGLVRFVEPGPVASYVGQGAWVERPELLRHLLDPPPDLELLDADQVAELAERYGVEPDADPLPAGG